MDFSVGGKTGIDTKQGKNLIGAFHQPSLVLADTSVLSTLPAREFRSGYAEIAKYGLLGDAAIFTWLESHWQAVFAGDSDDRLKAIATSIRKALHDLDASVPIRESSVWSSQLGLCFFPSQVATVALGLFGAFGLLLSIALLIHYVF